jgi:hypothetical protein
VPPAQIAVRIEKLVVILFGLLLTKLDPELSPGGNTKAFGAAAVEATEVDRFGRLAGLAVTQDPFGGFAVDVAAVAKDVEHPRFLGKPSCDTHFDVGVIRLN